MNPKRDPYLECMNLLADMQAKCDEWSLRVSRGDLTGVPSKYALGVAMQHIRKFSNTLDKRLGKDE